MPATEIVTCPLAPGSNPGDPSNPAATVLKEVGQTLLKTDGLKKIRFGMQVEKPEVLWMMIDWESVDEHKEFMNSEAYGPFFNQFNSIAAGAPKIVHTDFTPSGALETVLAAPVTEVVTCYFDSAPPEDYVPKASSFLDQGKDVEGYKGGAVGTTYEEMEKDGVKGKGAVLAIGWESVQKHMEFRETEKFRENIGLLRQGAKGIEMGHVQFMEFLG